MFFYILSTVLVLWYLKFRFKRRRLYELAEQIPGPPRLTSLFGILAHTFNAANVIFPLIKEFSKFAYASGGIIKLWAGPMFYVVLTDQRDVEYVLKNHLEKENVTKLLRDLLGNSSIFGPVHIWARRRKILVPAFTPKRLTGFVDILVTQSENLVTQLLRDDRVGTEKFSIWPYISEYALSSVAETSLGVKLDAQRNSDIPFLEAINVSFFLMAKRVFSIWLWPYWLFRLSPEYRKQEECKRVIFSLVDKIINQRREALKDIDIDEYNNSVTGQSADKFTSFLDYLIILSEKEYKVTNVELREEIMVLLLAGTDTSAVSICNTLKLLAMYPKVQEKVYAELMNVFNHSDRRLEKSDLLQMTYLNRVIKESLRLYAPVPIVARKLNAEVKLPSGVTLPDEARVIVSIWTIHRNPKYWGPNADSFDPDRFISEEDCGLLIPFSSGPRNCVGYQYALMSVKIVLATILRQYRIVGEEASTSVPDIDCIYSIMLKAKDGYQLLLEHRDQ